MSIYPSTRTPKSTRSHNALPMTPLLSATNDRAWRSVYTTIIGAERSDRKDGQVPASTEAVALRPASAVAGRCRVGAT